ncbi:MAG TPA: IclR family transcriptional regulator [Novosphingobium sp.]|nr:IclR family transcriptional regulator [Novosphingobium sp.]HZV09264.1 IclR family transcriptional regulator [Novosphingobium sp.]
MRNQKPLVAATQRSLTMLEAIVADRAASSVSALARAAGLPVATAHRQVATLVAEGFLAPAGHGRHIAGPRLRALGALVEDVQLIANIAAPLLRKLAARFGGVAQLGTFENDMVTYRVKTGAAANTLFTRVDMQMEAYCSGVGKVLLAHLPAAQRSAYLAGGPFVALTPATITAPADLARELEEVARQGFAQDRGEIAPDLFCLAVPIRDRAGAVPAALSLSRRGAAAPAPDPRALHALQAVARAVEETCFGRGPDRASGSG